MHDVDRCPSCGAVWLTSLVAKRVGCANAACDLRLRLPHQPESGDEWMPAGWCGGCETCNGMTVPVICLACTYEPGRPLMSAIFPDAPPDMPEEPVLWANCKQREWREPYARERSQYSDAVDAMQKSLATAVRLGSPVILSTQVKPT